MIARPILVAIVAALCAVAAAAAPGDLAGAAQRGQWAQVRSLLSANGNVRAAQPDGMTALHWAVQANQEEIVAALLKAGADPNAANRYGITPLWLAATNGSAPVTRLLLAAGADPHNALPHGETALMAAGRTGEPETIRVLLEAGADPNAQETAQGESALMWAAAENHPEAIRELIDGGANPDLHAKPLHLAPMDWVQVGMVSTVLPRGGWTAVMYAARQDAQEAARAVAEGGADLDAQDPDGATALQLAIINQHYDLAVLLMELGANPNTGDNSGMTAMHAAADMHNFRSDVGRPPRRILDKSDALDVLRSALTHGGDPNARMTGPLLARHHGFPDRSLADGGTPLMRAAKSGDLEAMQVLVDAGADPSLTMGNGSTAMLLAAGTRPGPGGADPILASLQFLADHGADVNTAGARGETPLQAAAKQGANDVVRALVEMGADVNAADSSGKTALEIVSQPGRTHHEDTAALLKELGAKPAAQQ